MNAIRLRDLLIRQEGLRLRPYKDSLGKLTIGVGRNLEDVGISRGEAFYLLENDIANALELATRAFAWFSDLDEVRQEVILNMLFNLGLTRLRGFARMLGAVESGDYELAAKEMLDSAWAKQVGGRAVYLSGAMQLGRFDSES